MLEFDQEHHSLNTSLKNHKQKLGIRNVLLSGMLISSIFLFSGCAKTVPCDIEGLHAHTYVNSNSLIVHMINEKEYTMDGWIRNEDYIVVSEEDKALIDFENKHDLIKIADNKEAISKITSTHQDYIEYEYKYSTTRVIPKTTVVNGKTRVTTSVVPATAYGWTTDANHNSLTGLKRIVHYIYFGYKIEQKANGKYKLVMSSPVDNIEDLPDEYKYINPNFYQKVLKNNKTIDIDYEDEEIGESKTK